MSSARRKRKLQELYFATVSFAGTPERNSNAGLSELQPYGVDEFLEANDISGGKFFDATTLRRVPGAELINFNSHVAPPETAQRHNEYSERAAVDTTYDSDTIRLQERLPVEKGSSRFHSSAQQDGNGFFSSTREVPEGTQARKSLSNAAPGAQSVDSQGPVVVASERPLRLGAVKRQPWHAEPDIIDNKQQSTPGSHVLDHVDSTLASPSFGLVHDECSDQDQTRQERSQLPETNFEVARLGVEDQTSSNLHDDHTSSGKVDKPSDMSQARGSNGVLNLEQHQSQLQRGDKNEFELAGALPTADAQLRFEEAQFLKPAHKMKSQTENRDQDITVGSKKAEHLDSSCVTVEDSRLLERRSQPFQERRMPGMTRDVSKDLMFSQRPPMRIDTGVSSRGSLDSLEKPRTQSSVDTQTPVSASTPLKATPSTAHPSPPERMTTRVSSGALRHKSVSEILGETPRSATHHGDKTAIEKGAGESFQDLSGQHTPRYGQLVASPESVSFRSRLSELKEREKERSKLSTVVFARQQPGDSVNIGEVSLQRSRVEKAPQQEKDYLLTLFVAQSQQPSLNSLISSAHKVLNTSNHYLDFYQQQDCRILKRIHHLQATNRWPLRQHARSQEPQRPTTQWDILLGHMKWMQTDFREERKWKLAAAKNIADWCAEWVASSHSRRTSLQVSIARNTSKAREAEGHATPVSLANNGENLRSDTTPDLVPSAEDEASDGPEDATPSVDILGTPAPAAIFSLAPEDVIFELDKTPTSDKLLAELPLYQPWDNITENDIETNDLSLDRSWKTPLVPISKFATAKMAILSTVPSRKRSRYDYEDEDEDEQGPLKRPFLTPARSSQPIPPEKDDVALFNPENKHIIDRLHTAHAFRPPSEFSMPSQSFFESRNCSQWTWAEDDELRKLVREYAYNWSLISNCLSSPSLFSSGAERRTPWECFERWVSFEGLPGDMSRTQYFRTWYSRRDAARTLLNQQVAAQQQQGAGSSSQVQVRRRTAEPIRVERKRNSKYLALIHAMQKVAKKKETTLQKQQHVASLAAMRKATEAVQTRQRMQTPQEFSRFKHERECRLQEKQEIYRQQMLAQQRAAFMQKASQQANQAQNNPNQPSQARNGASSTINGTSPHLAPSLPHNAMSSAPGQVRPLTSTNGALATGVQLPNGQTRVGGIPQAPMQGHMQGQQRLPHDMRVMMEASRVQQEQQQYLAAQRQQRYPNTNGSSSSPQPSNVNIVSQNNAAMLANLQAANGKLSPAANGIPGIPRPSVSPSLSSVVQAQQLSNGMTPVVNQIATSLKARHPNASPEQIRQLATEQLNQQLRSQNSQAAMQAAAGGGVNGTGLPQGINFGNPMLNPQMYTQYMHSQQSTQQNRAGASGINGVRPLSRDNTPQMRNGGTQGGTNHSPRPPQAQMAGSQ
ncbi:chromatin modification- protein VID21 [Lambiella insularis]|nr:chromatin modification- protein VID21 [Lambiella insularis]